MASKNQPKLSFYTQPWFVLAVVLVCFAILTPKIFIPLFRQIFGIKNSETVSNNFDRFPPPHMRSRQPPSMSPSSPDSHQFGRPNPLYNPESQGTSSSGKSILTFLLPIYAVGIGLYMVYTLFKVFNKKEKENDDEDESDYDSYKSKTMKFRERNYGSNFNWNADKNEFKIKNTNRFCRSEETEDELDNYEKYKNLDQDYVNHLKELRRKKRLEARKAALHSKQAAQIDESKEVPVTPNIGLSSVTNTNVLMNETLERMKYSLNKINKQLSEAEKKGCSLEDPDMNDLKLQLSQTEQQMLKIYNILNTVSVGLNEKNILIDEDMILEANLDDKRVGKKSILRRRKMGRNNSEDYEDNDDVDSFVELDPSLSSLNTSRSNSLEQKTTNLSTKRVIHKVEELNFTHTDNEINKSKLPEKKVIINESMNQINKPKKKKNKKKNK